MKLLKSERAEAEVVGHAILLSITILGIGMITLYGVPAIYSLEDTANARNVEQAFTVLDSQASRVTLGESPLQITDINLGGGSLTVEPNSTNHTSYMVVNGSNFNVTMPMGKIKYTLGDRIVAYEDGGVWSKYPSGGTVMISPPEFHYGHMTLTLPVFNFSGSNSVGGKGIAAVSVKKNATLMQYPTGKANRTNPLIYAENKKVYINITSDYYDGWAKYVDESISYAKVIAIDSKNKTVSIELRVVPNTMGKSNHIPTQLDFSGLDPTEQNPLNNFSFRIYADFNNFNWDIRTKNGNKELIFYLKKNTPGKHANLQIAYEDLSKGIGETWGTYTYDAKTDSIGDYIDVDLLNKSINLDYSDINSVGADNANTCQPFGGTISGSPVQDYSWDNLVITTSNANKTQPLYNITQHYIWKMAQTGDFTFIQCPPSDNQAPDPSSTVLYDYNATGALTYLQITDNKADVGIN